MENNRIDDKWTDQEWKLYQQGYTKKRCLKCHNDYDLYKNAKCPKCFSVLGNYIKEDKKV